MFACIDNIYNNGCDENIIKFLLSQGANINEIANKYVIKTDLGLIDMYYYLNKPKI